MYNISTLYSNTIVYNNNDNNKATYSTIFRLSVNHDQTVISLSSCMRVVKLLEFTRVVGILYLRCSIIR